MKKNVMTLFLAMICGVAVVTMTGCPAPQNAPPADNSPAPAVKPGTTTPQP